MLAHLARQVGQYFMAIAYLYFECGVTHTFDDCSINGDHVFFWNDVTSIFSLFLLLHIGPDEGVNAMPGST